MFSLISGCYEWLFRKEELHILIIGLGGAGKTLTLERLKELFTGLPALEPEKLVPTVGLNIARLEAFGCPLVLWDLGGQAGLRSIWDKYYGESHALVFVVDAAARARLDEAKAALERALGSRELYGAPLLVLANKADGGGAAGAQEVAAALGLGMYDTRPHRVVAASATTGEGLKAGLQWLVERVAKSQRSELLRRKLLAG